MAIKCSVSGGAPRAFLVLMLVCALCGCAWVKTRLLTRGDEVLTVMTYEAVSLIDRPIDEVYEYCTSWEHIDSFIPYARFETPSDDRIRQVGDHVEGRAVAMGIGMPWRWVVSELEPDRTIMFAFSAEVRGSMRVELEAVGNQTRAVLTSHIFFLPDSLLTKSFESVVSEDMVAELLDTNMTDVIKRVVAALEGRDYRGVALERDPTISVFVDAYFTVSETFAARPGELLKTFASVDGMNFFLPSGRVEPSDEASRVADAIGDHYHGTVTSGVRVPLEYEMVLTHYDAPEEIRFFVTAGDAHMELDVLMSPGGGGTEVLLVLIVDLPDSAAGQSLDLVIYASGVDQVFQQALANAKAELEK